MCVCVCMYGYEGCESRKKIGMRLGWESVGTEGTCRENDSCHGNDVVNISRRRSPVATHDSDSERSTHD